MPRSGVKALSPAVSAVPPRFHRMGLLVGGEALAALGRTRAVIFGLGGVGSWAAEALVRSGVGRLTIVDNDAVCVTNINRQVQALESTVGVPKAAALLRRLLEINPLCEITAFNQVFSRETAPLFNLEAADYVIDAIDSLGHKLDLIETASAAGGPALFSSMGMARRLDPARIKTADIWDTSGCPLAALVRQGLRKRGFTGHFTAVYSDEAPVPREEPPPERDTANAGRGGAACGMDRCYCAGRDTEWCSSKKAINGSAVTVTAVAGMILASLVIRDAAGLLRDER